MVRGQHTQLLNDMQNHAVKVAQFNANKDIQKQNTDMQLREQQANLQREIADRKANTDKEYMARELKDKELSLKQQELEIKRLALTQPTT